MDSRQNMVTKNSRAGCEGDLYLRLFLACYDDVAGASDATLKVEFERDKRVIVDRFHSEGISFLTKTIPGIAKAVDIALATGTTLTVPGFRLGAGQLPRFLGWLISEVFDQDGHERCEPSSIPVCDGDSARLDPRAVALRQLRQLCYLFYKLQVPPTTKQIDESINVFKDTERNLCYHSEILDPTDAKVLQLATFLVRNVVGCFDPGSITPRHGPGAVATGEKPHEKCRFQRYYREVDMVFPYEEHFFYNASHFSDSLAQFLDFEAPEHKVARAILVPKDSRGPRLISAEPLELQWIQQGIRRVLETRIEEHPWTKGVINFRDQSINARLALKGSRDGSVVTLDMKEASDRVSLNLVRDLFPPTWVKAIEASRSTHTILPSGEIAGPLRKCSPMGSAVCFPIESLVFWALSVAALQVRRPTSTYRPLSRDAKSVRVFGDDIICYTEDYGVIMDTLPHFGLMFNPAKCCTHVSFRESCGCDAYLGVDVTPLRIKKLHDGRLSTCGYVAAVAYSNAAHVRNLVKLSDTLRDFVEAQVRTPYLDDEDSPFVGYIDYRVNARDANRSRGFRTRFNRDLHRFEIRALCASAVNYTTADTGWEEMLRMASLRRTADLPPEGPRGLRQALKQLEEDNPGSEGTRAGTYAFRRRLNLKRRWVEFKTQRV